MGDPQQLNFYSYSRNNPEMYIDPLGLYIVETGEIEEGDRKKDITSALSDSLGIDITWDDIVQTGFYDGNGFSFEDGDIKDMVGWTTLADANAKDVTSSLDALNEYAVEVFTENDYGLITFIEYFREYGNGDLKNWNDNSIFGGGTNERKNWAYVYNGKLVRYDAPGNIHFGYVSNATGLADAGSASMGANFVQYFTSMKADDAYDQKMINYGYSLSPNGSTANW